MTSSSPTDRIELVPHQAEWAQRFAQEAALLQRALAPWLVGPVEHIGSTAVPGLLAKPVIDIMAPVASLAASVPAQQAAAALGYCFYPYQPDVMHWFCKPSPALRTHHLHLVPLGSALWHARLAFRDALRQDPALCAAYAALKQTLALRYADDREAYTDAKSGFIAAALSKTAAPDRRLE